MRNTTIYKVAGTETFRLASAKLWGKGSNLQNVEKSMRTIYEPDEGKILVQVDQAGAEALIVAYLCEPTCKLREMFTLGIKPHVYIGLMFPHHWSAQFPQIEEIKKLPLAEIKKHPLWKPLESAIKDSDNNPPARRYYYQYKQTCHSSNYDIKAPTFRLNILEKSGGKIVLTNQQAIEYLSAYHSMLPEIKQWHREVERILYKTKTLYNLFGYPRRFTGLINEASMKEAYAFTPQSTVGTITNIAYTKLQEYIEQQRLDWDLLGNCHDSYLVQCPIGEELVCAAKMKELIEQDLISPRGEPFKMKSEASVGMNWGPAKNSPPDADINDPYIIDKYNLKGLREIKI